MSRITYQDIIDGPVSREDIINSQIDFYTRLSLLSLLGNREWLIEKEQRKERKEVEKHKSKKKVNKVE